ncbi:MAG: RiPP maturation radical SAM C-methyltransferase [Desulfobacterales bacterium]|jgi:ribosomal peptide maturation radical SAM protein 1
MKNRSIRPFDKIALISMPWPLYSRPSIQLGTLKAFLSARMPELQVDTYHFYLQLAAAIGYRTYHEISERTWLAESIYAALLYPRRRQAAEALFRKESNGKAELRKAEFRPLIRQIKKATDAFIRSRDWQAYGLLGFSISLCQLTSTLYVIKRLKKKFSKVMIVVGGALIPGIAAPDYLNAFPEIDVVVYGEGEMPLYKIIQKLKHTSPELDKSTMAGIFTRHTDRTQPARAAFAQLKGLNKLPVPDYDDYFNLLQTFKPHKRFFATLPIETSRGCWWKRAVGSARVAGCAFCNLNLQWDGYRSKAAGQVAAEIDQLTNRHQTLSVAMMDNVLPRKAGIEIFKQIAKLNKDLRLFGEVRATTPLKELEAMRACGMREVQIGIEALSSSLLKKLRKGTSAIQNLEIMKNCEALGIRNISNLILRFPGSNEQDVAETLRALEFVLPLYPLKAVHFWLGLESPVWQNPEDYGIKAMFNHPNWSHLFPGKICQSIPFMIQAYRGDLTFQRKIWKPVEKKIAEWQQQYAAIQRGPGDTPLLSLRDGKDFIIIRQRRFQAEPAVHRLVGASRQIYLFCQKHHPIQSICTAFPDIPDDTINSFLKMMVDKKLMFTEKNMYLSLAAPVKQMSKIEI